MKIDFAYFTTQEFAKLHHINKRTLHYYDEIGLFSPNHKGVNGYRYYTYEQSMELENILALREMNMSLEEVKSYVKNPNPTDFLNLAEAKIHEIDKTITQLKKLKSVFKEKIVMTQQSFDVYDGKIELVTLNEEHLLMTPISLDFTTEENLIQNTAPIMEHLRLTWDLCTYKKSCGSFISLEKIKAQQFDTYDGIFTSIDTKNKKLYTKPKGTYIRAFVVGDWNKIPALYPHIIQFANVHNLNLTGYAFERGLNEFTISDIDAYITQIEILCTKKHV